MQSINEINIQSFQINEYPGKLEKNCKCAKLIKGKTNLKTLDFPLFQITFFQFSFFPFLLFFCLMMENSLWEIEFAKAV